MGGHPAIIYEGNIYIPIEVLAYTEKRLAELQEAVRWERECTETGRWLSVIICFERRFDLREIAGMQTCARDAVDALVGAE